MNELTQKQQSLDPTNYNEPALITTIMTAEEGATLAEVANQHSPMFSGEVIIDPELAAKVYADEARRQNSLDVHATESRRDAVFDPNKWGETARRAVTNGAVLVRLSRLDGRYDFSTVYKSAKADNEAPTDN